MDPEERLDPLPPSIRRGMVSGKSISGVETAPSLLEKELLRLRQSLPFVSASFDEEQDPDDASHVQHSNFALTMADLHNRAGSLYFFKGRQLVTATAAEGRTLADSAGRQAPEATEGYLLKALYHYAVSLQEIRRFNRYRRKGSKRKFNDFVDPTETIFPLASPKLRWTPRKSPCAGSSTASAFIPCGVPTTRLLPVCITSMTTSTIARFTSTSDPDGWLRDRLVHDSALLETARGVEKPQRGYSSVERALLALQRKSWNDLATLTPWGR